MTPCPACGGDHLRDLVYQHRTSCRIYQADDATVAADHYNQSGVRRAQNQERELIHEQNYPDLEDQHYGIRFSHHGGIHQRDVVVLDADGDLIADAHRPGDGGDDGGGDDGGGGPGAA